MTAPEAAPLRQKRRRQAAKALEAPPAPPPSHPGPPRAACRRRTTAASPSAPQKAAPPAAPRCGAPPTRLQARACRSTPAELMRRLARRDAAGCGAPDAATAAERDAARPRARQEQRTRERECRAPTPHAASVTHGGIRQLLHALRRACSHLAFRAAVAHGAAARAALELCSAALRHAAAGVARRRVVQQHCRVGRLLQQQVALREGPRSDKAAAAALALLNAKTARRKPRRQRLGHQMARTPPGAGETAACTRQQKDGRTPRRGPCEVCSNAPPFHALSAPMAPSAADSWSQARAARRCAAVCDAAPP